MNSSEIEGNATAESSSVLPADATKGGEAEKAQQVAPTATQTEKQLTIGGAAEIAAEPIPPTPDASKELSDVKELTSKLKTTLQTISLAKRSLIQQNG